MAFDEMKHHLSALDKHVMAYIDDSLEYIELKGFKASMLMITFMVRSFLMGAIALLFALFLSMAVAMAIGDLLGGYQWGFLVVAAIYIILGIICYFSRYRINRYLLRLFSKKIFEKHGKAV